ncbi:MAG TPA: TraR/DksA family transcriptional regulator, partial [Ramlibacter sp.]|nr:TraR/DksA family transcriptional regulator [Ramlibacter sp.]
NAAHDDVSDFKDLATRESEEAVDEVQAEHAAHELEQVLAARRRLQELTYGLCLDCGEPIDLRRLSAMPATPYCASCQSAHEQLSSPSRH